MSYLEVDAVRISADPTESEGNNMKIHRIYLSTVTMPSPGEGLFPDTAKADAIDASQGPAADFGTGSMMRFRLLRREMEKPVETLFSRDFNTEGRRFNHGQSDLRAFNVGTESIDYDPADSNVHVTAELEILDDDRWMPLTAFVFVDGEVSEGLHPHRLCFPIGMAVLPGAMSTDPSEGSNVMQIEPFPLGMGDENTPIVKLLLIARTADVPDAGTDSPIRLLWTFDDHGVGSVRVPPTGTFQLDFNRGLTNFYPLPWYDGTLIGYLSILGTGGLPESSVFTRKRLKSMEIINDGANAWLPRSVHVFGMSKLFQLVPLASNPNWPSTGWLSTERSDGAEGRPARRGSHLHIQ